MHYSEAKLIACVAPPISRDDIAVMPCPKETVLEILGAHICNQAILITDGERPAIVAGYLLSTY